jgi:hypothetical protein
MQLIQILKSDDAEVLMCASGAIWCLWESFLEKQSDLRQHMDMVIEEILKCILKVSLPPAELAKLTETEQTNNNSNSKDNTGTSAIQTTASSDGASAAGTLSQEAPVTADSSAAVAVVSGDGDTLPAAGGEGGEYTVVPVVASANGAGAAGTEVDEAPAEAAVVAMQPAAAPAPAPAPAVAVAVAVAPAFEVEEPVASLSPTEQLKVDGFRRRASEHLAGALVAFSANAYSRQYMSEVPNIVSLVRVVEYNSHAVAALCYVRKPCGAADMMVVENKSHLSAGEKLKRANHAVFSIDRMKMLAEGKELLAKQVKAQLFFLLQTISRRVHPHERVNIFN